MINDLGDSKVTIRKSDLLSAILANQAKHVDEHAEAEGLYRDSLVRALKSMLRAAQAGEDVKHEIRLVRPESHAKDYARVVRMLEMCIADEITITENQFAQYVQDEWDWMRQFKAVTSSYKVR